MDIVKYLKKLFEKIAKLKILVIGDLMLDRYIFGDVNRISPEAPVPIVDVEQEKETLGAAANVALNLRSIGVSAEVLGTFGFDSAGERLKHLLSAHSIKFDSNCQRKDLQTILKTRIVVRNQQLCRLDIENLPEKYSLEQIPDWEKLLMKIDHYDAIIFSNYAKGVITQLVANRVIKAAQCHGVMVTVDPKPKSGVQFLNVDLLKPNKFEAQEMLGIKNQGEKIDLDAICQGIFAQNHPRNLVITLGQKGMLVAKNGEILGHINSDTREVFDVSGAGDTSIAFLTAALAAGESIIDSANLANLASGIVVSKVGTATVTVEEILKNA